MTYNKTLADLKSIIDSTWEHLKINPDMYAKFPEKPILWYKLNRNLRDEIGQTKISQNKGSKIREDAALVWVVRTVCVVGT